LPRQRVEARTGAAGALGGGSLLGVEVAGAFVEQLGQGAGGDIERRSQLVKHQLDEGDLAGGR